MCGAYSGRRLRTRESSGGTQPVAPRAAGVPNLETFALCIQRFNLSVGFDELVLYILSIMDEKTKRQRQVKSDELSMVVVCSREKIAVAPKM